MLKFADQCVKNYLANWNGDTQRKDIISKMLLGKDPETGERLDLETIGADAANVSSFNALDSDFD